MCNRLRVSQRIITPGLEAQYRILEGIRNGTWGINAGFSDLIINARMENLFTAFWEPMTKDNRGIIAVDSFIEKGVEFARADGHPMLLPVVFSMKNSFAVVTMESIPTVKPIHHRMPALLNGRGAITWLKEPKLITDTKEIVMHKPIAV